MLMLLTACGSGPSRPTTDQGCVLGSVCTLELSASDAARLITSTVDLDRDGQPDGAEFVAAAAAAGSICTSDSIEPKACSRLPGCGDPATCDLSHAAVARQVASVLQDVAGLQIRELTSQVVVMADGTSGQLIPYLNYPEPWCAVGKLLSVAAPYDSSDSLSVVNPRPPC